MKQVEFDFCSIEQENKSINVSQMIIRQISYNSAMPFIVNNHYLHRMPRSSFHFGLFDNKQNIIGVIAYGVGRSPTLAAGICGEEEADNVLELVRLWVADTAPKNSESYFIANTIRLLDKEIIVSFADISQGHIGTIYQACNFIYCGLTTPFRDMRVKGLESLHHSSLCRYFSRAELVSKYGEENIYFENRALKHRYVFFNAKSKKRKKELLGKLKYQTLPYPKK